jgi:hypothetical protein
LPKLLADVAADFVRAVCSCYYLVVIGAGALAAVLLAFSRPADAALLAGVAVAGAFSGQVLMPRINLARDLGLAGDTSAAAWFSRLHRLSVPINAAQIHAAGIVLARFVAP